MLADPVRTPIRAPTSMGYVAATSAQTWVEPVAGEIERRGGPYPVRIGIDARLPWGLDLRLNGTAVGAARRFEVFSAVPDSMATA